MPELTSPTCALVFGGVLVLADSDKAPALGQQAAIAGGIGGTEADNDDIGAGLEATGDVGEGRGRDQGRVGIKRR